MTWRIPSTTTSIEFDTFIDKIYQQNDFKKASDKEKINFMKFAIKALKASIFGDTISNVLFEYVDLVEDVFPIDLVCKPTESKIISIANEGFQANKNYTNGIYYPEIDLVIIENGRHHAAAALEENITAEVDVYHLTDAFEQLSTDGEFWIINGVPKKFVQDIRFALIYDLAKRLFFLEEMERLSSQKI